LCVYIKHTHARRSTNWILRTYIIYDRNICIRVIYSSTFTEPNVHIVPGRRKRWTIYLNVSTRISHCGGNDFILVPTRRNHTLRRHITTVRRYGYMYTSVANSVCIYNRVIMCHCRPSNGRSNEIRSTCIAINREVWIIRGAENDREGTSQPGQSLRLLQT